jgi:hypothetical protein
MHVELTMLQLLGNTVPPVQAPVLGVNLGRRART